MWLCNQLIYIQWQILKTGKATMGEERGTRNNVYVALLSAHPFKPILASPVRWDGMFVGDFNGRMLLRQDSWEALMAPYKPDRDDEES